MVTVKRGTNIDISSEFIPRCYLCNEEGQLLYNGLQDYRCHTGLWSFARCRKCGLVWLNPRPAPADFSKVYTDDYHTHSKQQDIFEIVQPKKKVNLAIVAATLHSNRLIKSRGYLLIGKILTAFPPLREVGKIGTMCLDGMTPGRLLDVGCGGGQFLSIMKKNGWEVYGVEPDNPVADRARQLYGISIERDTSGYAEGFFDAVTMSHVIEHVYNPLDLLNECYRVLKPQGKLVMTTPNIESLGHLIFRQAWSLLDPSRHVYLFSMKTLRNCAERSGFRVDVCRTTAWYSRGTWIESYMTRFWKRLGATSLSLKLSGFCYQFVLELLRRCWKRAGEEIVLVASKE